MQINLVHFPDPAASRYTFTLLHVRRMLPFVPCSIHRNARQASTMTTFHLNVTRSSHRDLSYRKSERPELQTGDFLAIHRESEHECTEAPLYPRQDMHGAILL